MLLNLIPELLEEVLSYVSINELKSLSRCCHDLKHICRGDLWDTVRIPPQELLRDTLAQDSKFKYLTYTKVLRIHGFVIKNRGEESWKQLEMIQEKVNAILKMCSPRVLDTWFLAEGFSRFCQPDAFEEMRLWKYALQNSVLAEISNTFPKLERLSLNIGRTCFDDDGLSHLKKLTNLKKLVISQCESVSDASLKHIAALTHLKEVCLWACHITDQGMYHLQNLRCLEKFEIRQNNEITDRGLLCINHPTLVEVRVFDCPSISNRAIGQITTGMYSCTCCTAAGPHLKVLHLHHLPQLTAQVFPHISRQVSLRDLKLSCCPNINHGSAMVQCKDFAPLKHLTKFDASCSLWIDSTTVSFLEVLTSLKELILHRCQSLTNRDLRFLQNLTALEVLDIGDCRQINDGGMLFVNQLNKLRELDISGCYGVTNFGALGFNDLLHLEMLNILKCTLIDIDFPHVSYVLRSQSRGV